jgi:signal transduction histidine kinase
MNGENKKIKSETSRTHGLGARIHKLIYGPVTNEFLRHQMAALLPVAALLLSGMCFSIAVVHSFLPASLDTTVGVSGGAGLGVGFLIGFFAIRKWPGFVEKRAHDIALVMGLACLGFQLVHLAVYPSSVQASFFPMLLAGTAIFYVSWVHYLAFTVIDLAFWVGYVAWFQPEAPDFTHVRTVMVVAIGLGWGFLGLRIHGLVRNEVYRRVIDSQKDAMVSAARARALWDMAEGMAHEINNPMTIVRSWVDILRNNADENDGTPTAECTTKALSKIEAASVRVVEIVRCLRRFGSSSIEEGAYKISVVSDVIGVINTLFKGNLAAESVTMETIIEPEVSAAALACSESETLEILQILVQNAVDALTIPIGNTRGRTKATGVSETEADATPTTLASARRKQIRVRVARAATDDRICISVEDSGPGVPDEVRPKIFDPFFSTRSVDRGKGLGLSVALGTARRLGGELWLQPTRSQDLGGARFVCILPKADMARIAPKHAA